MSATDGAHNAGSEMSEGEIKVGQKVTFKAGRSGTEFTAEVVGVDGQFFVTKDSEGKQRKARKGSCRPA